MGVLRYFPGSEPPEETSNGQDGDPSPFEVPGTDRGGPPGRGAEDADGPAVWAVPGVGVDAPEPAPSSRASRRAENVAMAALTRHDVSVAEMTTKLAARGLDPAETEAEVERLLRAGLLDDQALAERLVRSLRERKGLGDAAIRPALRARKLPPQVIDAALEAYAPSEDALQDRLAMLAEDRAGRLGSLPLEVAERRLTGYLLRKGYGGAAVRDAVRSALEGGDRRP